MYNTLGKTQKAYSKNKPTKNIIPKNCVAIFPIELVSGRTQISNQGILPTTKYYDKGSFLYYQEVLDGRSALKIQWEDSIYLEKPEGKNYYLARPQVGLWYYGKPISMSEEALEISENESFEDFVGLKASQTITLYFEYSPTNRQQTKEDIEAFFRFKLVDNDIYNLYQIPEICENKLMYIQSHNEIFDDLTGKSKGCQITFASLGDKIQKSGKAIEQYCSWNAPGEFAVIPKIVKTYDKDLKEIRNVVYDNAAYVSPTPVRYLQVEQQGPALTSCIYALGRRQEWDEEQRCWKIGPSKILVPCDFITTQPNPLNRTSTPSKNFFFFHDEQVSFITSAGFWKMITDSAQQPLEKMQNGGLITLGTTADWKYYEGETLKDGQKVGYHLSNQVQDSGNGTWYDYYSKVWTPLGYLTEDPAPIDTNGCVYSEDSIAYSKTDTMIDIMLKNIFIFNQQPIIPLSMGATRPYYLRDIPIIGSIANFFKLGDFHLNQNTTNRKASHLAFFGDCSLMGLCANTFAGMSNKEHPWSEGTVAFPINFFGNNETQWSKFGVNACNTTLCMELSDRIQLTTHGETKVWDTIYLAQSKYEDGTYIFDDHNSLLANSSIKVSKPPVNVGYIIDAVIVQSIFEGKIKISCYGEQETNFIYPLWTATILSNAAWENGAMRDWTNFFPLSNWEERFCVQEDKFTWPDEPHKDITSLPTWNVLAKTNSSIPKDNGNWYQDVLPNLSPVNFTGDYGYCNSNKSLTIANPSIAFSDLGDPNITSWETLIAKYQFAEIDIDGSYFEIEGYNYKNRLNLDKRKFRLQLATLSTEKIISLTLFKSKLNTPYIEPKAIGPFIEEQLSDDKVWLTKFTNSTPRYSANVEVQFKFTINHNENGMTFVGNDWTKFSARVNENLGQQMKTTDGPYTELGPSIKWEIKVNSIKFTN